MRKYAERNVVELDNGFQTIVRSQRHFCALEIDLQAEDGKLTHKGTN